LSVEWAWVMIFETGPLRLVEAWKKHGYGPIAQIWDSGVPWAIFFRRTPGIRILADF